MARQIPATMDRRWDINRRSLDVNFTTSHGLPALRANLLNVK
jgi:hypothetical protein